MKTIHLISLFLMTYLAVFMAGRMGELHDWVGAQPDFLPGLIVYCGLSTPLPVLVGMAVFGGLLFDALSANPMGLTMVPLFVVGVITHWKREVILRDQLYAQFFLGAAASAAVPIMSVLLLLGGGQKPLLGWGSLWQLTVLALIGGALTPLWFRVFDRIQRAFGYAEIPDIAFRADREIKRGRN